MFVVAHPTICPPPLIAAGPAGSDEPGRLVESQRQRRDSAPREHPTDRQLHATSPLVQARVLEGTARLTAAIPPVADRLSATLRRYTVRSVSLERLVALGSLEPAAAAFLTAMMRFRSRIAVSGEPP